MATQRLLDIKSEIDTDPLGRGYSGMTDVQVTDSMNNTIDRPSERESLTGGEIANAIVASEFNDAGVTDQQRANVRWVADFSATSVDVTTGSAARSILLNAFGSGTTTRTNLSNLVSITISRAEELGLGEVKVGEVEQARSIV